MRSYTELDTREYYNSDDKLYRSFWDKDGNCHWGYFTTDRTSLARAMTELNRRMLNIAGIDKSSNVLDLGCGNGNNSFFLRQKTKAHITGIDLSDVRIENANKQLLKTSASTRRKMRFVQGTATNLPLAKNEFTHIWSQATIYHVHNKANALREIARVLKPGGVLILDDLIKPQKHISELAKRWCMSVCFSIQTIR